MKNLLWLLLGAAIGAVITFKYLENNASDGFLEKLIANKMGDTSNKEVVDIKAPFTKPMTVVDAKKIISQYRETLPYRLDLIANNKGDAIESWVIDLREVESLYKGINIQGLRLYLAKNKEGRGYTTLVATGATVSGPENDPKWTNVFGPNSMVLQYVLPCPDNCNTVEATRLGDEKKK